MIKGDLKMKNLMNSYINLTLSFVPENGDAFGHFVKPFRHKD